MMIRRSRGLLLRSPSEIGAGKNGKEMDHLRAGG